MKVLLKEDISKLGVQGEIKEVSDGYARNFLFPRALALVASPSNVKRFESETAVRKVRQKQDLEAAQALAPQIEALSLEISARAGREGHLFGSVTAQAVADALLAKGFSISRRQLILESHIKQVGEHKVSVRLHPQLTASLKIVVSAGASPKDLGAPPSPAAEISPVPPVS